MADAIVRLKVESQEYDSKLKRAADQMARMEQEVRRTGATFAYADKEEIAFVQSLGNMSTQASSAKSKLREYTDAIMSLTATYRAMTDEERSSEFGQAMAASIDQIKAKAAELKDVMNDTNAQLSRQASDTAAFDSLAGGIGTAVAAFQTLQGAMNLFGVENKDALQAIAKLQAAMAITNGLTKLQTALQKQSAVMLGVTTVQKKAAAAAEKLDTVAKTGNIAVTKAATVAQAALNAVAMANPYVLLATAIIAVGAALFAFCKSSSNAEEEEKKRNEAAQKAIEIENERAQRIAESAGKQVLAYSKLSAEWKNLSTEQERNEWIKNNQNEFKNLGIAVNNVADAENVFVKNTENMVKAFQIRAQAAAYQSMAEEMYTKYIRVKEEYEKHGGDIYAIAMDATKKEADRLLNKSLELQQQAEALIPKTTANPTNTNTRNTRNKPTTTSNKPTTTSNKPKQEEILPEGSIAALEKKISKAKEKLRKATTQDARDAISKDIAEMEQQLSEMKVEPKVELPKGSMKQLKEQLSSLQEQWDLAANDDARATIKAQIEEVTAAIKEMEGEAERAKDGIGNYSMEGVSARRSAAESAMNTAEIGTGAYLIEARKIADLDAFSNLVKVAMENGLSLDQENMRGLLDQIDLGVDVPDQVWEVLTDQINEQLKNLGLDPIVLDVQTGGVEAAQQGARSTADAWNNAVAAVNNVGDALQQIEDPAAKVSGIVMQAVANIALGFAQAAASQATGAAGVFGWIAAATAGVATMASTIAAIKSATSGSYASGGIIPGNSYSGDNLTANVNAGELILNRAQQASVAAQLIDSNPMSNMRLSTEISGQNLRIVMNNDNRARGGSRNYYSEIH